MLTTITTILGLMAMAIGIALRHRMEPMATCFIAGLSLSTIMTMLLIPMLYERLELGIRWFGRVTGRNRALEEEPGTTA